MNQQTNPFREAAVDLAAKLHTASHTAAGLADALNRSEQTIALLKKHMTPAQLLHAHLEIDALPVIGAAAYVVGQQGPVARPAVDVTDPFSEAFCLIADGDSFLRDGFERMTAFGYFKHGAAHVHGLSPEADRQLLAAEVARLDRAYNQALADNEQLHSTCDMLASGIGDHFKEFIGEHTNGNCPWNNALLALDLKLEVAHCACGASITKVAGDAK
ncbi:hypothetical protein IP91_02599 [Pseudoduganella lurida]|uniref:Uncharacterized protein n=1 Tax=Pseudoduganella lurida TaxID=1036180 RepID=A0A562R7Z7_9BURK|nr:hypothetical protein [Pseudoduganella lurida]TWI65192.1 hypothetical protein IP91_02599 [Pseudoduganella lurida]